MAFGEIWIWIDYYFFGGKLRILCVIEKYIPLVEFYYGFLFLFFWLVGWLGFFLVFLFCFVLFLQLYYLRCV